MGKIIYEKQFKPKIEKQGIDLAILRKRSNGRTAKGIVIGYMKKLKNSGCPFEYLKVLESLYKEIRNLEISEVFRVKQWKGKSGVHYIEYPDKVIAIRYRRLEPGEEPKEVQMEISKEEINNVIVSLNQLNIGSWVETFEIAEKVYGKSWKQVFANRYEHIHLVEVLNYLEYKGFTEYSRSGKTRILKNLLNY